VRAAHFGTPENKESPATEATEQGPTRNVLRGRRPGRARAAVRG